MKPSDLSGFDPRVQDQLAQLSLGQETRSSPASSRSSYHSVTRHPRYNHSHTQYNTHPQADNMNNYSYNTPSQDAFPPLGSTRPTPAQNQHRYHPNQPNQATAVRMTAAQDFFARARGARGRGRSYRQDNNDFARAPRLNNHRATRNQSFASHDQHRGARLRSMDQADYLDYLAQNTNINMLPRDEIDRKHAFRQKLEALAKSVSETYPSLDSDPKSLNLRLQSYGSLSNGFGTSGCDVDLLLTVEKSPGNYVGITEQYKLDLEKAMLDLGLGARLLTNTRIPIIRICEHPTPELLENLREHRKQRDADEAAKKFLSRPLTDLDDAPLPLLPESQGEKQSTAFAHLDSTAADVPLPKTPVIDHAKLEFVGDCGIQCDINFTNHVALLNTKMLWTYGQCDVRVLHMGIFVKNWAKARAINTPYHGTLSSYGYVMMVLHYLTNIANPPVIPNLQVMAVRESCGGVTQADVFEGFDVRFVKDLNRIRDVMAHSPKNTSSLGALLHGFFRYYASNDGFNWTQDVISIRSFGGILTKQSKDWTGAKWTGTKQNVRLRYLLAIEDPFELEHNVARTVGHNGIKAIRDEFRRSWGMIQGIQRVQDVDGTSWVWTNQIRGTSGDGLDFIKPSEDRGDLLKKDAEFRKEQLRLLKQKTEADEEWARKQTLTGTNEDEVGDSYGMSSVLGDLAQIDTWVEDQAVLIQNVQLQDRKVTRMKGPDPTPRKPTSDEDDLDGETHVQSPRYPRPNENPYSKYANERATLSSRGGSESWATACGGNAPGTDRCDNIPTDSHKVDNEQNSRNTWNDASAIDNHDDLPLDHEDSVHQPATSYGWGDYIDRSSGKFDEDSSEHISPRTKHGSRFSQLPRDEAWTRKPDHPRQYKREIQRSDRVGSVIKWSSESVGGRWLLDRDARIRAGGKFELTAGERAYLHAKFPYDPEMTHQQLAEKNDQLEKFYRISLYPRRSSDMQSRSLAAENRVVKPLSPTIGDSWNEPDTAASKVNRDKIIDASPIGDGVYWSEMTGVGRWLRWRDRKILAGLWNPRDSLATLMSDCFPRGPKMTVADQEYMNWELDNFFADLDYPRPNELTHKEMDEAADAIRDAIRRTQKYRASKDRVIDSQSQMTQAQSFEERPRISEGSPPSLVDIDEADNFHSQQSISQSVPTMTSYVSNTPAMETEQSKILLDIFKLDGEVSPRTARHALDLKDQNAVNARSIQVVMNLSSQLSKRSSPEAKDLGFVRARRLAYYLQPQSRKLETTVTEDVQVQKVQEFNWTAEDGRKDSAIEGSWNQAHASSSCNIEKLRQDDSFW